MSEERITMTTLYKKVGRRYKPVAEHEEWDSYPKGAHLVVCSPGSTLRLIFLKRCNGTKPRPCKWGEPQSIKTAS